MNDIFHFSSLFFFAFFAWWHIILISAWFFLQEFEFYFYSPSLSVTINRIYVQNIPEEKEFQRNSHKVTTLIVFIFFSYLGKFFWQACRSSLSKHFSCKTKGTSKTRYEDNYFVKIFLIYQVLFRKKLCRSMHEGGDYILFLWSIVIFSQHWLENKENLPSNLFLVQKVTFLSIFKINIVFEWISNKTFTDNAIISAWDFIKFYFILRKF